jgi:serine/threonine protein kinase
MKAGQRSKRLMDPKDKSSEPEPETGGATRAGVKPLSASRIDTLSLDFLARLRTGRRYGIGETLAARYRIVRDLDDGGMGQVFVAENLSIGRNVAIKVLKPELLANEEFRKRFQKEADAIAAIAHQNVVRFLDLVVGDPTFLVMEYVEGPTLSAVLKQDRSLDPLRATELSRRLCWGLDAAHRAGVIHRDVKPSNIILASDAESGEQPKLIDFGVAKLTAQPPDAQLTRHGQIVGTPHYMCPEQITGGEIDARSDIYSLGCVLYHMIAGRPPFVGVEEYQILSQHVEKSPEPVADLVPGVPAELQRVLQRALSKAPSSRFESMQEMARALAAVPGLARPGKIPSESTTRSMPRPSLRVRLTTSRKMVVAAALITGVAGLAGGWLLPRGKATLGSGVIIASDPPGATIELDGHRLGETTPTAIRGVAPGDHRVSLHLDGHADVERNVSVHASERAMVELALPPRNHRVDVKSAPSGAIVFLDGKVVAGTTPTVMTVTDDDFHELRIERSGYEILTVFLKPEDHQPELQLTLEPEKEPRGVLSVDGPSAAEVWLDGAFTGFTTPTLGFRVRAGDHVVELRAGNLRSSPTRVAIHQGDHAHLTLSLIDRGKP